MAAEVNYTIIQGATFRERVTWQDSNEAGIDLTGATVYMQVRDNYADLVAATILDLENGSGITLSDQGTSPGQFTIELTPAQTEALSWTGTKFYDVEVHQSNGDVFRILQGRISLSREVTRN